MNTSIHLTPRIRAALATAEAAAQAVRGTTSPNPAVGAVILDASGDLAGVGATQPPGGAHAEVMALREAGSRARGGTAVVTLEPCNHTGRTGPCTRALLDAGVGAVYYAERDPDPAAAGGGEFLRAHGVAAEHLDQPVASLAPWLGATRRQRPHLTLKFAGTLDGFAAATDGSSRWITGEPARAHVHLDRSRRDAILVGTGTVLADDPALTARRDGGLHPHQPRRVVVGTRAVPAGARLQELGHERYPGITEALAALWDTGARDVLLEGGPTLAAAALQADLVDAVQAYVAPAFLGAGRSLLTWAGESSMAGIRRFHTTGVQQLGEDVLIEMTRKDD